MLPRIISELKYSSSSGEKVFTAPTVPTGINTGVSILPWSFFIIPVRALHWESFLSILNFKIYWKSILNVSLTFFTGYKSMSTFFNFSLIPKDGTMAFLNPKDNASAIL